MSKVQTSIRLDEETFHEAREILKSLGMNFTEAVNIFTAMVVQERGLPFDVKIPEYPAISFEEAQEKVARALENMGSESGISSDACFSGILER